MTRQEKYQKKLEEATGLKYDTYRMILQEAKENARETGRDFDDVRIEFGVPTLSQIRMIENEKLMMEAAE